MILGLLLAASSPPTMVLSGSGFSVGTTAARFERTGQAQAIALAVTVLGQPVKTGSHGDCGQGEVIRYATFPGGFELSFVRGRLSGWTADGPRPVTDRRIAVGATVTSLRRAYPDVETDPGNEREGGLGPHFQREGGPNGWISGVTARAKVTGLFAGATCLTGI